MMKMPPFLDSLLFSPRWAPLRIAGFGLVWLTVTWLALTPHPPRGASLGWDKANHASAFAALTLLARLAWPRRSWKLVALAMLACGGAIELIQSQIPERDGEWLDLLADAVGISIGLAVHALLQRLGRHAARG